MKMERLEMYWRLLDERKRAEREKYFQSSKYKLHCDELDFKCWCHSKGRFYNLGEKDFKEYKKALNLEFPFSYEMIIYQQWFGYDFEYDTKADKWRTVGNKHLVLNPSEIYGC